MLLYEKKVNGISHIFGAPNNIPSDTDLQAVYKDAAGNIVELTKVSDLRDDKQGGMLLNGTSVFVWVGNERVIPAKVVRLVSSSEDLVEALNLGGKIILATSIALEDTVTLTTDSEIDLAGNSLVLKEALPETAPFFIIANGCKLKIKGTGQINAYGKGYALYAKNEGTIIIEGTPIIKGDTTAVQCAKGTIIVEGGDFEAAPYDDGQGGDPYRYTINCIDKYYTAGTAIVKIRGGRFYKFNPADNQAETQHTNFVDIGYKAVADGDYFIVIPE